MTEEKKTAARPKRARKSAAKTSSVIKSDPVVHYSQGVTRNTGNYNSIKVQIGIELPFDSKVDKSIDDTLERAREFISDKLRSEVDAINAHITGDK